MIEYNDYSMLDYARSLNKNSNLVVVINPVNLVGVMGAGVAKIFRDGFPEHYNLWRTYCQTKLARPGDILVSSTMHKYSVVALPTKEHWKNEGNLELIKLGMQSVEQCTPEVVVMPKIGSGLARLEWSEVAYTVGDILRNIRVIVCTGHIEPQKIQNGGWHLFHHQGDNYVG